MLRRFLNTLFQLTAALLLCLSILFLVFAIGNGDFNTSSWQAFTIQVRQVYDAGREAVLHLHEAGYLPVLRDLWNKRAQIDLNTPIMPFTNEGHNEAGDYIHKDGIWLKGPYPTQATDVLRLEGYTTHGELKVVTDKATRIWHELPLEGGLFAQDIYFVEGSGTYEVHITYRVEENTYRFAHTFTVTNKESDSFSAFLIPGREIESDHPQIIAAAEQITQWSASDREKIRAVYDWVQENISYDDDKAFRIENNLAQNDEFGALHVLHTRFGVCQDYASLAAALLRASGIEAKLVMGMATNTAGTGPHAWNEAYDRESERWILFDATWASTSGLDWFDVDLTLTHEAQGER